MHDIQMNFNMFSRVFPIRKFATPFSCILHTRLWRNFKCEENRIRYRFQKFEVLAQREDLWRLILVFNVEGALLKSSALFPYFMLVAFEAGSLIRASILLALYPIISLVNREVGLRIMVMICFLGLKQDSFTAGIAVFPKFFLEDVGLECFKVLGRGRKKIGVTDLPRVMVESFLREYLEIDLVVGRELKVCCGYFLGIMEEKDSSSTGRILDDDNMVLGINSFDRSLEHHLFFHCKEIYMVSEKDKENWQPLSRGMYPRPLVFHDGRLAFKPRFVAMLITLIWLPLGFILSILRIITGFLPYKIGAPFIAFTGFRVRITNPQKSRADGKGRLYICNHRTLLDPVFLSGVLQRPLTAVTYSLSRVSEILSPIKTVRLTRNRDEDAKIMEKLLSEGDVVVCPEGTTCREPYLLRFSPLFSELSNDIVPVAVDACVSMFYGTTAGGFKCLDPFFFLMNPIAGYAFELLEIPAPADDGLQYAKFEVANLVQSEIGKALGFTCTKLTRKDKYFFLTGR